MCFGKQPSPAPAQQQQQAAPAPAAPPPSPLAEQTDPASPRRAEDKANFGATGTPNLRVDRSVSSGGVGAGGTGIRM